MLRGDVTYRLLKSLAKKLSRGRVNARLETFAQAIPAGAEVLNVGSGGAIARVIAGAARDVRVLSTDIDEARAPDMVDDITASQLGDARFDAVVMSDVLEHVQDPQAAADELLRVVKPGGRLFLAVPFLFPTHDAPYDFFRFTEFGVRHLFRAWEIETLEPRLDWAASLTLLMWRHMWMGTPGSKLAVLLLTIWLIPAFLLAQLFRPGANAAATMGFIAVLKKPALAA